MAIEWTDELKQRVIDEYVKADPTADNSISIVNEIAEDIGATPNGVRLILSKAGVYVKKTPQSSTKKEGSTSGGGTRISKADAVADLTSTIESKGLEADSSIIEKLTGKAAVYFANIIKSL